MTPNTNKPDEKRAEEIKYYRQIKTAESNPLQEGWYDTDKGSLYYLWDGWSCREDRCSDEYPAYWLLDVTHILHAKSEECERLTRENERMFELLYDYEQWEADIISCDEMWAGSTSNRDALPLPIYEQMLVLQRKRNEILHPTK